MPAATARARRLLSASAGLALTGVAAGVVLASGVATPPPAAPPDAGSVAPATATGSGRPLLVASARPAGAALVPARTVGSGTAPDALQQQQAVTPAGRASAPADFVPVGTTGLLARTGTVADWAPDGSRYVVAVGSTLVSRRADGSAGIVVASKVAPTGVSWSRDGLRIAVTTRTETAAARLFVTSPLGGSPTRVTLPGGTRWANLQDATWLGAGSLVAVAGRPTRLVQVTLGSAVAVRQLRLTGAGAPSARSALADPAVSPDGKRLAYREVVPGGGQRLLVVASSGGAPRVVAKAPLLGRPVWSADGAMIWSADPVRRSATVVERVAATGAARTVATLSGAPELYRRPVSTPARTERVQGASDDLVGSLVAASAYSWASGRGRCAAGHAQTAVLVPARVPAKALAAAALAGKLCGPVLAVRGPGLDAAVLAELRRVLDPAGRSPVHLVGTAAELPVAVERAVRQLGRPVVRIGDRDVQAAALAIAKRIGAQRVLLVAPDDIPSAAAATAPAHAAGAAVLFTRGRTVDRVVVTWLSAKRIGAWAVGARAQRAAPWAARVGGADPVATALDVARTFYFPTSWPLVASSGDVAGSVSGALVGSAIGVPLLQTTQGRLAPALRTYLDAASAGVQGAAVLGGGRAVPAGVLDAVRVLTGGVIPLPGVPGPDPTPDPTPTPSPSGSSSPSPSPTGTPTGSPTASPTGTPSPSSTPSSTPTPTGPGVTPTPDPTGSPTPTATDAGASPTPSV